MPNTHESTPQSELEFLDFFRRLEGLSAPTDVHTRTAIQRCQTLTLIARGIDVHPSDCRQETDLENTAVPLKLRDAKGASYQLSSTRGDETFAWGVRRLDTRFARLSGTNQTLWDENPHWPDLPHAFFSLTRSRATGYPEPGPFGTTKIGFEACWMGHTMFVLKRQTGGDRDLGDLLVPFNENLLLIEGFRLMQEAWQLFGKRSR